MRVTFAVEQAGCESCGKVIDAALSQLGTVESIAIDAEGDTATVVLSGSASSDAVDTAVGEGLRRRGTPVPRANRVLAPRLRTAGNRF